MPNTDIETMILQLPDKWNPVGQTAEGKTDIWVFPTGQEPDDWEETLRHEAFHSTGGMDTATRVYELRAENDQQNCPGFSSEILSDEPENGYSMIYWKQVCELGEEETVASLNKVVLGNDQLYILSKIWKYDPPNRTWRRWETYMEGVYVCDPTRPQQHRCVPVGFTPATVPAGRGGMRP